MRKLLYVPIIHDQADMGSAGAELARGSAAQWGQPRWAIHEATVCGFWKSIRVFLLSMDPWRLGIYQDGLAAEGEVGRRIVNEAARRGSKNYRLVQELLDKGAGLHRTEDPVLLWREHQNVIARVKQEPSEERSRDSRDPLDGTDRLLEERDRFIANAISSTLKPGEVGVLFIGAYHDVAGHLAADISVEMAKDREKVNAYFQELIQGRDEEILKGLARYLTTPVAVS